MYLYGIKSENNIGCGYLCDWVCNVPIWDKKLEYKGLPLSSTAVCSVPIWDKKMFIGGIGIGIAIAFVVYLYGIKSYKASNPWMIFKGFAVYLYGIKRQAVKVVIFDTFGL